MPTPIGYSVAMRRHIVGPSSCLRAGFEVMFGKRCYNVFEVDLLARCGQSFETPRSHAGGPGNDCVSRSSPQAGSRPSSSLPHVLCQEYRGVEVRKLCRGLPGAREISMVFVVVMVYARDTSCTGCTLISESPCQHRPLYD
jgi:hypothetical protein